jgi:hypothetical protein
MSGTQVERTLLWLTAVTVVVGLSAWAERRLRAQATLRGEQADKQETGRGKVVNGVIGLIGKLVSFIPKHSGASRLTECLCLLAGNTPLVRIDSLSDALGVEILVRIQHLPARLKLINFIGFLSIPVLYTIPGQGGGEQANSHIPS